MFLLGVRDVLCGESAPRTEASEIEAQSEADAAGAQGPCRHKERIEERLALRWRGRRSQRTEVDELSTEGEDGFVEQIIHFNHGAQAHSFANAKLARDAEVEGEQAWTNPGVTRQVPRPAYRR